MEIKHQSQQTHLGRLVPEGGLWLGAFGRGVLKKVGHQPLDVVVAAQVDKGVVAVAFFHVDKVDDLDLIAFCFQKPTGVP